MTPYQFECWKRKMRRAEIRSIVNCEGYIPANKADWYAGGYQNSFWWK